MHPKADRPAEPAQSSAAGVSGKWVIIGILAVALTAAGGSWWFRYSATHKAAVFWEPRAAGLIRDASFVELIELRPAAGAERTNPPASHFAFGGDSKYVPAKRRVVSAARGLVHLRNALLEDRSFVWDNTDVLPWHETVEWRWLLVFADKKGGTLITFSKDCHFVMTESHKVISCEPIAAGLAEMFAEMSQQSPVSPADSMSVPAAPAR